MIFALSTRKLHPTVFQDVLLKSWLRDMAKMAEVPEADLGKLQHPRWRALHFNCNILSNCFFKLS